MVIERGTICYWGHLKVLIIKELKLLSYVKIKLLEGNAVNSDIVVDMHTLSREKVCEYSISLDWLGGKYD